MSERGKRRASPAEVKRLAKLLHDSWWHGEVPLFPWDETPVRRDWMRLARLVLRDYVKRPAKKRAKGRRR